MTSTKLDAETLRDMIVVQELYQVVGDPEVEIPIDSIMIGLEDLPQHNALEHANDDVDVPTDKEE